ncbi:hypothetical protein FS749_000513 [Ceratobasidium sp. UAMH 11750]|nr:hypothetical protein FS749_000513 [Ceratobasidium sp. UAMH 11750]
MHAIAQSDDIAVGRIIQTALQNGAGIETIIDRIVRAQQGLFSPQNYSQKAFDLVALVLKIGGPRLAFAVAKAMHLPSTSAVHDRLDLPQLQPSIGFPTKDEVLGNIESFFGRDKLHSSCHSQAGISLMIDELAVESRPCYDVNQDAVIGICREHANPNALVNLSSRGDTLETLLGTKTLLESGGCHRAREVTMAAIARFGQSDYNASVILASGTCKTEKTDNQARLIGLILESWRESPSGEALHGQIWSACTDGDPGRRRAFFQLFMTSTLSESSDLFRLIGHLPLLNLCCGPTQITHDGDYKHEEKRLASAMRSRTGILVNGAHITPKMLVKYLRALGDLSESRILSLFDGTDPQNVPKANALLANLHRASQLPTIASHPGNKPFVLLGEVIGAFVHPFTIPSMSLAEQIASLTKCGHLLFALYRIDGTKFLPGQLYYDIQTSIKNAVFCVAKTQLADASLLFYLLQTGTDRLESRFGTYRTTTSDRNGDILQMCNRAASAQHIDDIFSAHPSWNRAPYRLSLDGRSGIDHTNPLSWTGDVVVGHVNLRAAWLQGQSQAAAILTRAGVPFTFDPAMLLAASLNVDLMRPHGSYPGIQTDDLEPILQAAPLSELADDPTRPDSDIFSHPDESRDNTHTPLHFSDEELGIEHLEPASPQATLPECSKKGWVLVDNKRVHLQSVIRCLLGTDGSAKSTDRLRRVCGFTRYLGSVSARTDSVMGDYFQVSDLVATFLRAEGRVALAIARVTNIIAEDGRLLESISEKQFSDSSVTLSGQLLELENDLGTWYWTHKYDSATNSAASAHRKRHTGFDFDARLCRPVTPGLAERNGECIWAFNHTHIKALMDELWAICANFAPEDNIPVCQPSATFPYRISDDPNVLVHLVATEVVQHATRPTHAACFECGKRVAIKKMRVHVGQHLLSGKSTFGVMDANKSVEWSPCGFCGRHGTCNTWVERQHKAAKALRIVSDCPFRDTFSYSPTPRSSKSNPCTNRPVQCPACPPASGYIWSYNLQDHVRIIHYSRALPDTAIKYIQDCKPSEDELTFMNVERESSAVQAPNRRKRARQAEPSDSSATEPSSSRRKHS